MGNFSGSADGADPVDPAIPYALNMETLCLFCSAKRRADLLDGLRLALEELAAVSREREREHYCSAKKGSHCPVSKQSSHCPIAAAAATSASAFHVCASLLSPLHRD